MGNLKMMPASPLSVALQHLVSDLRPEGDGRTDGELLACFVKGGDEDALAALVRRNASMVWGVCRRLLNHHDAEDAFQATFLVLVRKAGGVPRQAVANWLYGVARQTAVRVRATAAKRGRRETQVVNIPEPTVPEVGEADLQVAVDEELSRLPDHYRCVIILCDLEGMTRKETARQLGIPEGSVASRLARARALLAKRLAQRGIAFSGGSAAALFSAGSASASAPPALVASTIKVASLLAAGQAAGVVSVQVAALTDGVVKAMFMTKIKSVLAVILVVTLFAGSGLICRSQEARQPQDPTGAEQAPLPTVKEPSVLPSPAQKPTQKPSMKDPSMKDSAIPPVPVEKSSPKNARKVPDVLTPEEAIKQKGLVTVQFKVAAVEVIPSDPLLLPGQIERPRILLKDGNKFSVVLRQGGTVSSQIMRLGIDPANHFTNKTIRVIGRVQPGEGEESPFNIVVEALDQLEVVREQIGIRRENAKKAGKIHP